MKERESVNSKEWANDDRGRGTRLVVGGSGKGFRQIKDVPDSYVAADDIEVGIGNKIPLWLFGFLY